MRLFREGKTQTQIADEFGITRQTVAAIVKDSENGKTYIEAESQPEPTIEAEVPDIPQEVEPEIDAAAPLGSELAKAPQDALEAAPELEPQDATEDIEPPNRKRELDLRLGRLGTFSHQANPRKPTKRSQNTALLQVSERIDRRTQIAAKSGENI